MGQFPVSRKVHLKNIFIQTHWDKVGIFGFSKFTKFDPIIPEKIIINSDISVHSLMGNHMG